MKGLFITFEGPDGAGKTTQLQWLGEFLAEKKVPFIQTREPGGTHISDQIRHIILHPEHKEMASETEVLLYAASRSQHVFEKIVPALEQGKVVLCDRFVDASVAYQGFGLGFGEEIIKQINHFATGGLTPDRTYLIDITAEEGRARLTSRDEGEFGKRLDRIEQKGLDYHRRVREGFYHLADENHRILMIDGGLTKEEIREIIKQDIIKLLNL